MLRFSSVSRKQLNLVLDCMRAIYRSSRKSHEKNAKAWECKRDCERDIWAGSGSFNCFASLFAFFQTDFRANENSKASLTRVRTNFARKKNATQRKIISTRATIFSRYTLPWLAGHKPFTRWKAIQASRVPRASRQVALGRRAYKRFVWEVSSPRIARVAAAPILRVI